jgi:hypothetical protein
MHLADYAEVQHAVERMRHEQNTGRAAGSGASTATLCLATHNAE